MAEIKGRGGDVEVVVPDTEVWKSGEIRAAGDSDLFGVVAHGPDTTGNTAGTVKRVLHCCRENEVRSVSVGAQTGGQGQTVHYEISTNSLVAAGGAGIISVTDVRILADCDAGTVCKFWLNNPVDTDT